MPARIESEEQCFDSVDGACINQPKHDSTEKNVIYPNAIFQERLTVHPKSIIRQKSNQVTRVDVDVTLEHSLQWSGETIPPLISKSRLAKLTQSLLQNFGLSRFLAQSSPHRAQDPWACNGCSRTRFGTAAGISIFAEFEDSNNLESKWAILTQTLYTEGLLPSSATPPPYASLLLSASNPSDHNDELSGHRYHVPLPQYPPFTRGNKTTLTAFFPIANEGIGSWGLSPQGDTHIQSMMSQTASDLCLPSGQNYQPLSSPNHRENSVPHIWMDMWSAESSSNDSEWHLSYGLSYTTTMRSDMAMSSFTIGDLAILDQVGLLAKTAKTRKALFPLCHAGPLLPSALRVESEVVTIIPNTLSSVMSPRLSIPSNQTFLSQNEHSSNSIFRHNTRSLLQQQDDTVSKPWISLKDVKEEQPEKFTSLDSYPKFDLTRHNLLLNAKSLLLAENIPISRSRSGDGTLMTCTINRSRMVTNVTAVDLFPINAVRPWLDTMEVWFFQGLVEVDKHLDTFKLMESSNIPESSVSVIRDARTLTEFVELIYGRDGSMTILVSGTLPSLSAMCIAIDYTLSFSHIDDFGATPNRGIEIPASFASFVTNCNDNDLLNNQCTKEAYSTPPSWYRHQFDHTAHFVTVYSSPLIIMPPIPDMSMPFNVVSITSTFFAFVVGSLLNILVRKSSERITKSVSPPNPSAKERLKKRLIVKFSSISHRFFPGKTSKQD